MICSNRNRRIALLLSIVVFFILINVASRLNDEQCDEVNDYLPLVDSTTSPNGRHNIFFIESTQPCNQILNLNLRQTCSIESAARQNPGWNIFLYIVDAKGYEPTVDNIKKWNILRSFKNIHIKVINAKNFTVNTPVEQLFEKGLNSFSSYLKYHRSDILRYTLLWKYSGTYLDLDVISRRPMDSLGYNFAVEQEKNYVTLLAGAGAINFDSDPIGREIASTILYDLAENFDGHKWDDSSVRVLTRAIVQLCGTDLMWDINAARCKGFKVHPVETFYPISFSERDLLMDARYGRVAMEMVRNAIGVHAWNKVTADQKVTKTSSSALMQLAKKNCPSTFEAIEDFF